MKAKGALALTAVALLAGCSTPPKDFMREPSMSPVGSGVVTPPITQQVAYPAPAPIVGRSLWNDRGAALYSDPRALNVGDIVTVKIVINDKASLDNNTKRSRESDISNGLGAEGSYEDMSFGPLSFDLAADNSSDMEGKGNISRKENINLSVAAVVTQVLPNGNLFISGQQEVRVNYEVRVLSIAGIIRPRDILPDNTIFYDKIAEARISYGGRGRITDVQQPGWGQQIYDAIAPY
ncbi:flagellar basal body L-ring protein FlgH [Consotaella aegiceratis]|uniref:flagellar basal body L-ring protein FlgH n=1 Tax=Consotaella aegiceratis TaxID=3097961 RepID=UPI003D801A1A